jgi:hypothetical protein
MFDWGDPEALWILTNWCIGAAVVVSGLVLAHDIVKELRLQVRPKEHADALDDHAFLVPELGMTMADGGERRDKTSATPPSPPAEK